MAQGYLCIVVADNNDNIAQLNQKPAYNDATKPEEGINALIEYLRRFNAGCEGGTIQVTTRDSDPSISTSGSGSQQVLYSKP